MISNPALVTSATTHQVRRGLPPQLCYHPAVITSHLRQLKPWYLCQFMCQSMMPAAAQEGDLAFFERPGSNIEGRGRALRIIQWMGQPDQPHIHGKRHLARRR